MNLPLHWKKVNDLAATLPENVMLTSIENDLVGTKPGSVVACDGKLAAERIVGNTHRLATPQEIAAAEEREVKRMAKDEERQLRRSPKTHNILTLETQAQIAEGRPVRKSLSGAAVVADRP